MFGEPHHDAATVESILGDIPATGMFCQGELGPVASSNFLHGFTASIALFR
jgi:small ligand-binding sensory domain FIST